MISNKPCQWECFKFNRDSVCRPSHQSFLYSPYVEAALADLIDASQFCSLRRSCVVEDQEFQSDRMIVRYTDQDGNKQSLRCSWLVGADGKKGVVRKHFLEPSAGVKQVDGRVYSYEGTWVAANLKIDLTTPSTHPQLPFWELGMTPEQVYVSRTDECRERSRVHHVGRKLISYSMI